MLVKLILLLTVTPLIELAILIKLGMYLGVVNTLLIVVLTGVFGAILARSQGLITLSKIQRELQAGVIPSGELLNGVLILAGGLLLLTPGLITDGIGFALLIPLTRNGVRRWLENSIRKRIEADRIYFRGRWHS